MTDWSYADVWDAVAEARPAAEAVVRADRRISWADLARRSGAIGAELLAAGLRHQSRVAQYLYNTPEYLESLYACLGAGLVPVNTNYRYTADELTYLWDNADAEAVVFDAAFLPTVEQVRPRLPAVRSWLMVGEGEAPAWAVAYEEAATSGGRARPAVRRSGDDLVMIYTGGTTGMPKGVMWRQDDLFAVLNRSAPVRYPEDGGLAGVRQRLAAPDERPPPRHLPGPPLMHGTGLLNAMTALAGAGCVVLCPSPRFDPEELLDTVERERVSELTIVGDAFARPLLAALDAQPDRWDLGSLWLVVSSGVMWSAEVKAGLGRHLPRLLMVDSLGSSEAVGVASSRSDRSGTPGTAGFRLGEDTRVLDEHGRDVEPGSGRPGLLAQRGRGPLGYHKDPEKSAATFRLLDGERWTIPGDVAEVAADGSIVLLGRGSVVINTGGEKVHPEEVEEALKRCPGIDDALVVGVPDERFGQVVVAVVAPAETAPPPGEAAAWVRRSLAAYKAPRHVLAVSSLERAANGKADYRRWRDEASARLGADRRRPA